MPVRTCLMHVRASLAVWGQGMDWPLTILAAGFVLTVLLTGAMCIYLVDPFTAYQRAIVAAALKRPDYRRALTPIETPTVDVVTFRRPRELPLEKRTFDIWVGLASEAHAACKGAANPIRRLQQSFGLPPNAAKSNVVTELEVRREDLIRPCVGQGKIDDRYCDFKLPDPPPEQADAATLRDAYERLRFVTKQMWSSYRMGFRVKPSAPSDYPYEGFPFTGMGWSYDWSGHSSDHFGVSEFVIKRDAKIKIVSEKPPAEFCTPTSDNSAR